MGCDHLCIIFLAAKILWHLIDYGLNAKTASEINEQIRKRRLEQTNKNKENKEE